MVPALQLEKDHHKKSGHLLNLLLCENTNTSFYFYILLIKIDKN